MFSQDYYFDIFSFSSPKLSLDRNYLLNFWQLVVISHKVEEKGFVKVSKYSKRRKTYLSIWFAFLSDNYLEGVVAGECK